MVWFANKSHWLENLLMSQIIGTSFLHCHRLHVLVNVIKRLRDREVVYIKV